MLPVNWKDEEKEVRKCVDNLKNQLDSIDKQVNNFSQTPESIAKQQHTEKLRLEQKDNKTEEDMKRLQALTYLEAHPEEQKKINEETIKQMKIELKY
jgi:hypothetical protein